MKAGMRGISPPAQSLLAAWLFGFLASHRAPALRRRATVHDFALREHAADGEAFVLLRGAGDDRDAAVTLDRADLHSHVAALAGLHRAARPEADAGRGEVQDLH